MKLKYSLLAIVACVLWGSAFVAAKIGFRYMGPFELSGVRFMLAGIFLWPLLIIQEVSIRKTLKRWRFLLFFAFLQTFLQYGLFFAGLNLVPAATAAMIAGGAPLVIAILAHFTMQGDKMTWRKIGAILLGIAGVAFISLTKGEMLGDGSKFYVGVTLLLISSLVGGSTNIVVAKYMNTIHPIALTSFANLTGGLLLFLSAKWIEKPIQNGYPTEFWIALCWLSFISAAGFSIWYTILKKPHIKVSELNMWKFIIPVTGCILSWTLLPDEVIDLPSVLGITIITISLLLYAWPSKKIDKETISKELKE